MSIDYDLADEEVTRALNSVVRAMLRIASQDFEAATKSGLATVDGPHRNLRSSCVKRPSDREQVRRINEHFEQIVGIMAAPPRDPAGATLHAITFLMSPMEPHRRAPRMSAAPCGADDREGGPA